MGEEREEGFVVQNGEEGGGEDEGDGVGGCAVGTGVYEGEGGGVEEGGGDGGGEF